MEHIWTIFTLGRLTPPRIGCIILASPTSMLGVSRSTAVECGDFARAVWTFHDDHRTPVEPVGFSAGLFSWSGNCHFYGMFKIMAFVELIPTMLHIHPGLTREHQRWACRWMPLGLKESSAQLSGLLAHGHIGKQKDPSDPKKHGHIQKV